MDDSRELFFSDEELAIYGKLHASFQDVLSASSYGDYILKKQWKAKPWSRGSTYLQQSAFETAMVTSYARAFTNRKGWPPLPAEFLKVLSETEMDLHYQILKLRHQVYAHSDSVSYDIKPWKSDHHSDISRTPIFEFHHDDIHVLRSMCKKVSTEIAHRMAEIKAKYV